MRLAEELRRTDDVVVGTLDSQTWPVCVCVCVCVCVFFRASVG